MRRIMIAGTASGCGKTTITCAILQALVNRGKKVVSFKCGPDYIDPMFHSKIIGIRSRNLDGFFMEKKTAACLLERNSRGMDIAVIEGVMGYYDGVGMEDTASSYALARDTKTPVVLVVMCKGMSRSIQAVLNGYLHFAKASGIRGVIFNELPSSLYPAMKIFCEKQGVQALGFFPKLKDAELKSRHLGLVTADEIDGFKEQMLLLAQEAEIYLDIEGLLALSEEAGKLPEYFNVQYLPPKEKNIRIAAARDAAFCFYYEDNLMLLRDLGCEIVPFSPLTDTALPEGISGLILGGGYPELYGRKLEQNISMRNAVKRAVTSGLPTHAECGGFLYLHKNMHVPDGAVYEMAGVLDGTCMFTDRLQHFGYVTMTAKEDNVLCRAGDVIKAHEFHRFVSDVPVDTFDTVKNDNHWMSYAAKYEMAAGFPHIHYYANPSFARHFVERCTAYKEKNKEGA